MKQQMFKLLKDFMKKAATMETQEQVAQLWRETRAGVDSLMPAVKSTPSREDEVTIDIKRVMLPPGQFQGHVNMMRNHFDKMPRMTEAHLRTLPEADALYILRMCIGNKYDPTMDMEALIKMVFHG